VLWTDPWYQRPGNTNKRPLRAQYAQAPLPGITNGKTPTGLTKRGLLDPREIVVDTGNSSRRATDEELLEDFGLLQCEGDCKREMDDLGFASLPVLPHEFAVPQTLAEACPTPATTYVTVTAPSPTSASVPTATMVARTASRVLSAISSVMTESAEYAFWDGEVRDEEEDCE
jgi:chitinase